MTDIDLHLHSYYSDGTDSPAALMERAFRLGFHTAALTDHDVTGGLDEAAEAAERLGMNFVPGIEFSCEFRAPLGPYPENIYFMHILGHGIDGGDPGIRAYSENGKKVRAERNRLWQEAFERLGHRVTDEELEKNAPAGFICKRTFCDIFVQRGYGKIVNDIVNSPDFFRNPEIRRIHMTKISADDAVALIRSAGGKAAFAHPFQFKYPGVTDDSEEVYREKLFLCIEALRDCGLEAVECCYPTHSADQRDYLLSVIDRLGMKTTRGSDDHGAGVRPVKNMGEFAAEVPESRLEWIKEAFR